MSPLAVQHSKEDVLDAFSVEPTHDRSTLERYLSLYPQFAAELVDLCRELSRIPYEDTRELTSDDVAMIESAWQQHVSAQPDTATDPFSKLSANELRDLAMNMDVPRQVITAFREHRIDLSTVPQAFLTRLSNGISATIAQLSRPTLPQTNIFARSYKADQKPTSAEVVSFERVLLDAGVSDEKRARLLKQDN